MAWVLWSLAKGMMSQAVKEYGEDSAGDSAAFVETMTGDVLNECDKLRKTLKDLCDLENDCKNFQKLEANLREKVSSDMVKNLSPPFSHFKSPLRSL